jgi:hypothetical protein
MWRELRNIGQQMMWSVQLKLIQWRWPDGLGQPCLGTRQVVQHFLGRTLELRTSGNVERKMLK